MGKQDEIKIVNKEKRNFFNLGFLSFESLVLQGNLNN